MATKTATRLSVPVNGLDGVFVQMYGHVSRPNLSDLRVLLIGDRPVFSSESKSEVYVATATFFEKLTITRYPSGFLSDASELLRYFPPAYEGADGIWRFGSSDIATCDLGSIVVIALDYRLDKIVVNRVVQVQEPVRRL